MSKVVVTGSFSVEWDVDEYRSEFGQQLTDEEILEECGTSVLEEWDFYATNPDSIMVDAELIA
jgi:hypothetical protein